MIAELLVPFRDARADHLTLDLRTGAVEQRPALASLCLRFGGVTLDLRILGASHQVFAAAGAAALSEVVACDTGDGALPPHRTLATGPFGYAFRARVKRCDPAALQRLATALERHAHTGAGTLIGRFPGDRCAMTALDARAAGDAVEWRTWHLYPGSGEVVRTRSVLRAA